jgi:hypothetical protein
VGFNRNRSKKPQSLAGWFPSLNCQRYLQFSNIEFDGEAFGVGKPDSAFLALL